jgi:hypothetical protein
VTVQLSAEQRRFLWVGQSVVPFAINVVLNGAIGWAMFHGMATIPLWGSSSIGGDTKGAAPAFDGALAGWLRPFQRSLLVRAAALGLACVPLAGGAAVALLAALGVTALDFAPFVGWKALYAGVLGALVTPAIALLALADRPGR